MLYQSQATLCRLFPTADMEQLQKLHDKVLATNCVLAKHDNHTLHTLSMLEHMRLALPEDLLQAQQLVGSAGLRCGWCGVVGLALKRFQLCVECRAACLRQRHGPCHANISNSRPSMCAHQSCMRHVGAPSDVPTMRLPKRRWRGAHRRQSTFMSGCAAPCRRPRRTLPASWRLVTGSGRWVHALVGLCASVCLAFWVVVAACACSG
jgi:hypothetical protein